MAIKDYYQTITKVSYTKVSDNRGGYVYTEQTAVEFQGLINDASSQEILMAEKLGITVTSKLFTAVTNIIEVDDIVKDVSGDTYRVVSKSKNTVHRDHHFRIMLQQISLDEV